MESHCDKPICQCQGFNLILVLLLTGSVSMTTVRYTGVGAGNEQYDHVKFRQVSSSAN